MMQARGSALWSELSSAALHHAHELGKVECVHFDDVHALLWAVDESGRIVVQSVPDQDVVSCSCPFTLQDGTSAGGGVVDAAPAPRGHLVAMASHAVRVQSWEGRTKAAHVCADDACTSVTVLSGSSCAAVTKAGARVTLYDLERFQSRTELPTESPLSVLRTGTARGWLAAADEDGHVGMMDPRTGGLRLTDGPAHRGGVHELCANSSYLATCGVGDPTSFFYDSVVQVFDCRRLGAPIATVPATPDAFAAALHPTLNATLLFTGTLPYLTAADAASGALQDAVEIATGGHPLTAFTISSSGELAALASGGGYLHLYTTSPMPRVNAYELEVDVPPSVPHPVLALTEHDPVFQPSYAMLSAMTEQPSSSAEPAATLRVGLPPRVVDAGALQSSALQQKVESKEVRTMRNPRYVKGAAPGANAAAVAALRNQRVAPTTAVADLEALVSERKAARRRRRATARAVLLPDEYLYQSLPVRKKEKAFVDLDFAAKMSHTAFSGLENLVQHSYVNALLQVLYFTPALRAAVLSSAPSPFAESLLLDEIHFLFNMLLKSRRAPCQASNLMRVLGTLAGAESTGLLPPRSSGAERPTAKLDATLPRRIVKLTDFVLTRLDSEVRDAARRTSRLRSRSASAAGVAAAVDRLAVSSRERAGSGESESVAEPPTTRLEGPVESADGASSSWVDDILALHMDGKLQCVRHTSSRTRASRTFVVELSFPGAANAAQRTTLASVLQHSLRQERTLKMWFNEELGSQLVRMARSIRRLPDVLILDSGAYRSDAGARWQESAPVRSGACAADEHPDDEAPSCAPLLPWALSVRATDSGDVVVAQGESADVMQQGDGAAPRVYVLTAIVSHVRDKDELDDEQGDVSDLEGSLVAEILVPRQYWAEGQGAARDDAPSPEADRQRGAAWVLFNDFTVREVPRTNVRRTFAGQKVPALLFYSCARALGAVPPVRAVPACSEADFASLCRSASIGRSVARRTFEPLDLSRSRPGPALKLALDAEFVALTPSQRKLVDGREYEVKPMAMGLARVSAVVGNGPQAGCTVIDDHIAITSSIHDYLTKFSGLRPGDLHPATSPHHLTTLKRAYVKLKYLVDSGCRFVGHGLRQDFRMINIFVPPEQIIDTVELYRLPDKRMLSLRFLASFLLRREIQRGTHDSIEDAQAALDLHAKYEELCREGAINAVIHEMYAYGKRYNWRPVVWVDNRAVPAPEREG